MHVGAISDGNVSIQPWQIPRQGDGGSSSQRSVGQHWTGSFSAPSSQGLGSTGIGGSFVQGSWPGKMAPVFHRGFYGGEGIRTGGAY